MRLVALSVLPIAVFTAWLVVDHVGEMRRTYDQQATGLAANLANTLDNELQARIVTLQVLANLPQLRESADFATFHAMAEGFLHQQGSNIVLMDREGKQLLSTRRPFGLPLPTAAAASFLPQVLESRAPVVTGLFQGVLLPEPLVAVLVPVLRGDEIPYVLGCGTKASQVQELIGRFTLPPGWSASVLDGVHEGTGGVIARTAGHAGRASMEDDIVRFVAPSRVGSWLVVLEVPTAALCTQVRKSVTLMAVIGLAALLISVIGGGLAGRRLATAVAALAAGATDRPASGIRELDALRDSLRAAEAARQEAGNVERRMASVLACTTDAIIEIDRSWHVSFANDEARRLAGGRDLVGRNIWEVFPEALGTTFEEHGRRVMDSGEPASFEAFFPPLQIWLAVRCFATPDGVAGYIQDISAHKQAEDDLKAARSAAERANRAKSRFLAAASHDLRQPFQAMALYRDVLAARLDDAKDKAVLEALGSAMAAGQELLSALLDLSALEAGVAQPRLAPTALDEVLRPLAQQFRLQSADRGLQFRHVPCSASVVTDPVLLARMVRNLLTNALKYTTSGTVLLGCRRLAGAVRVEVWDTGPGIPPGRQADIWEEFTQLDNPGRDRARGMGLGLAVVAKTGQLLHHPVDLRSWPGRGSVFSIEVPLADHQTGTESGQGEAGATRL